MRAESAPAGKPERSSAKNASKSPIGQRIGPYVIVDKLASGGMAEIYLARHDGKSGFSKELVLKVLQSRFAEDETVRAMFLEEARLGGKLSHPSVVDVYDAGEDAGAFYIAMEYIRGKTLTDVMLRAIELQRPLPLRLAALIVAQVADGLAYLRQGIDLEGRPLDIVHRDISPMNLVVGVSGHTKIIDFGIAKQGKIVKEESGVRPGKLAYMSPEQVKGLPIDGRSDVFALGTILYEITVGRRLWRGQPEVVSKRIVEETAPPPTYLQRDYPPALELVVQKALEKRPEARYASGAEMCEDLEAFLVQDDNQSFIGRRQVGRYLHELFAPGAQVSERGVRRARAFMDDEGALGDEDIDFDRQPAAGAGAAFADALRASGGKAPTMERVAVPGESVPARETAPVPADARRLGDDTDELALAAPSRLLVPQDSARPLGHAQGSLARPPATGAPADVPAGRAWLWAVLILVLSGAAGLIWAVVRS